MKSTRGFLECTVCHEIFRPHPGNKIVFAYEEHPQAFIYFDWPKDYCECCALITGMQDYCELVLVRGNKS